MSGSPHVTLEHSGNVLVVSFPEQPFSIHEAQLDAISGTILSGTTNAARVLIDMSGVEFFGSSFIELLFRIWKRVTAQPGGQFAISGLGGYCREVLDVTNLTSVWPIYDTRDSAIQALNQ